MSWIDLREFTYDVVTMKPIPPVHCRVVVGAFFKRVCSGHTAAPATPLGRLRSWLCCHPGKNPVVPSYVPEACQSPPSVSPPGARRQRKGMLGIYGVVTVSLASALKV